MSSASDRLLVVVGDALLDRDVDGTADRLCPDAPVPVLAERSTVDRPGGAALAAALAADLGYEVVLITALGADAAGEWLRELAAAQGVHVCPIGLTGGTPQKIRLRAQGQVLLRLDRAGGGRPTGELPATAGTVLRSARAVLVSDYGGGVTAHDTIREALRACAPRAPLVWDPHPRGAVAVPGARLVTPNEPELHACMDTPVPAGGAGRLAALARGAVAMRRQWRAGAVAVTLGAHGALLCHAGPTPLVVAAPATVSGDTCGAGDKFAATAAAALGGGALVSEAVQAAVTGATGYVAAGGPAVLTEAPQPTPVPATAAAEEIITAVRARGGTVVASGGCFDLLHAGHVATLEAARRLGDCLVVCLNSDASVRMLKGADRPVVPQADRARLLQALGCVDAVAVFDETTPDAVLARLRPDVWVKGGDYTDGPTDGSPLPEAELVRRWGGQTVVVPYLAGRSTTRMIDAARRSERSTS